LPAGSNRSRWSGFGFEADDAFLIDQIKVIRPTGILLDLVLNSIDQRGEWDVELTHARACHIVAFGKSGRALREDAVPDVARHLPDIAGTRFGDVATKNDQMPVRGAWVALLPNPLPNRISPTTIRYANSGDGGTFIFKDVAPGMYQAVVLDGEDDVH
jgi:hypothetical protein